jgi:glycogen operon protein
MPEVPPEQRGTYAGLAHPAVIRYLEQLGITAIELMPVHQFVHEGWLLSRGLRNYWGYNSIGYFAPHNEYSSRGGSGEQVREFREMVKALHAAGIEVILDVVYNHTAEGNHLGPTFSFKGIDNVAYYRTVPDKPGYYFDYTGTGTSSNSSWIRYGTGCWTFTSMDSGSTWPRHLHANCTKSIACPPSSTSSSRIQSSAASS